MCKGKEIEDLFQFLILFELNKRRKQLQIDHYKWVMPSGESRTTTYVGHYLCKPDRNDIAKKNTSNGSIHIRNFFKDITIIPEVV